MIWAYVAVAIGLAVLGACGGLYALGRWLQRREPYASILRLRNRQRIAFLKSLIVDHRIPWFIKIIPVLLIVYLASPIDLIPDFVPVLGYLDDVVIALAALALLIRLTPGAVIDDLMRQATV